MNANEFRRYAITAFRDLSLKYRLVPLETPPKPRDFTAHFHNNTTTIAIVGVNYGFGVNVRLASSSRCHMKFESYDFDDLLVIRAPDITMICPSHNDTNEIQKQQIDAYAKLLDEYASDVLSGDFAVFPLLAQTIQTRVDQQEREGLALQAEAEARNSKAKAWWKWW